MYVINTLKKYIYGYFAFECNVIFINGYRMYLDIFTGENYLANMYLIYWSVRSSSRIGGERVKVDGGYRYFSITLSEYMKMWCNIQVIICRFLHVYEMDTNKTRTIMSTRCVARTNGSNTVYSEIFLVTIISKNLLTLKAFFLSQAFPMHYCIFVFPDYL